MPYIEKTAKVTFLDQFPEVFHASIRPLKWVQNV
jgi:hypothetical protein